VEHGATTRLMPGSINWNTDGEVRIAQMRTGEAGPCK
jgi:hypothetical protein